MTPSSPTARRGRAAETAARWHLRWRGWRLLARNVRSRYGEIDLVCRRGTTVAFVEVRLRGPGSWLSAAESVDRSKQRRLIATAHVFMTQQQRQLRGVTDYRFDVVSVTKRHCWLRCSWIQGAFTA